jgi:peroxiredoxin
VDAASTGVALRRGEQARRQREVQGLIADGTVGTPAPALRLPDLEGRTRELREFRGQVVLVNFWATWCPPCRREIPALQRVRGEYRERGFEILGVALDDAQAVRDFVAEHGLGYPQLLAGGEGAGVMGRFGNPRGALPYSVLVDREGVIRLAHLGELPPEKLVAALEPLL